MSNENKDQVFVQLMGPIALDQAEKALAKVVAAYVGRLAGMKLIRTSKTIGIAQDMGEYLLIDFAQNVYGLTREQATIVIQDAIEQARIGIRKTV